MLDSILWFLFGVSSSISLVLFYNWSKRPHPVLTELEKEQLLDVLAFSPCPKCGHPRAMFDNRKAFDCHYCGYQDPSIDLSTDLEREKRQKQKKK